MSSLTGVLVLLLVGLSAVLYRLYRRNRRLQQRLAYTELQHQRALAYQPPSAAWDATHFESTPLPVLVTDERRTLLRMNPAAEALFGPGVPGEGLIKRVRTHLLEQLVADVLAGKTNRTDMVELPDRGYFLAWAHLWQQRNGNEHGAVLILQDVTEQHRLARSRRDMVDNLSHELRTPLTSVKIITENLLAGVVERPDVATRFVQRIAAENEAMILLIEDLTTLSFVESGRMPLRLAPYDLRALVEQRIQRLVPIAMNNDISFVIESPPSVELDFDYERMGQVLTNLLHNALKYSPEHGTIHVQIEPHECEVAVRIRDEGIGILATDLPRIFERFYKVNRARTRSTTAGTGLGLAIAKHIVESHGGKIEVESEFGHGATFIVILPRH